MNNSTYISNKRYRIHFQLRKKGFNVDTKDRMIYTSKEKSSNSFFKIHFDFLKNNNYKIQITTGL